MKQILLLATVLIGVTIGSNITYAQYGYNSACSSYGSMAYESGGYCQCMSGYVMGTDFLGNKSCVSGTSHCQDKFGYNARYDSLSDSCECGYGYVLSKNMFGDLQCISDDQACRDDYGLNARAAFGGKCECRSGYGFQEQYGSTQCVSFDSICYDRLGTNSDYNSLTDSCGCDDRYELSEKSYGDGLECKSCFSKYGLNSSWSYSADSCECDDGYTLSDAGKCVEKHNSAYFTLLDISDDDRIIVESQHNFEKYIIDYGFGCPSYLVDNYEQDSIVINMGTDFSVDRFDTLVLQDHDRNCSITSVDWTSDFTFEEESSPAYSYYEPASENSTFTYTPPVPALAPPEPLESIAQNEFTVTAPKGDVDEEIVDVETEPIPNDDFVADAETLENKSSTTEEVSQEALSVESNQETKVEQNFIQRIFSFFKSWF